MTKQIRKLVAGLLVLYVALFGALNLTQVVRKDALDADPKNNRQTIRDFNRPRGQIVTADGVVVAQSVPSAGETVQVPGKISLGDLFGNVTGYYTYSFGATGAHKKSGRHCGPDCERAGGTDTGNVRSACVPMCSRWPPGARYRGLVIDGPTTGAIIAMISTPRYDPNLVATHDTPAAENVLEFLDAVPGKPLLANAYQERYMPGSSFKVITTGIALEHVAISLDSLFPVETECTPPQTTDPIQNYAGTAGRHDECRSSTACNILRPDGERLGAGSDDRGRRLVGRRREVADRSAGCRGQQLLRQRQPVHGRLLPGAVAPAGDRRLRAGQHLDGAAAHVHGGLDGGQQGADDEAVRRGRHPRP
jgi:hypothetical protein